jgi:flagellar biosynthesis/type III secretory pathway M-ring protein FliF/YscJ
VTGSTGTLFLYGIVVGVVALFGLWLLLAGARHTSRRGRAARRRLRQSQRETAQSRQETAAVAKDRDELIGQRDTARAYTASTPGHGASSGNGAPPAGLNPSQDDVLAGAPAPAE